MEKYIVEYMPDHLISSHVTAGNWGRYPCNGAEREEMTLTEAYDLIENDKHKYAHIIKRIQKMEVRIFQSNEFGATNGWPIVGSYVSDGDYPYKVTSVGTYIHTSQSGSPNYVYGEVEEASWDDVMDGEDVGGIDFQTEDDD